VPLIETLALLPGAPVVVEVTVSTLGGPVSELPATQTPATASQTYIVSVSRVM
jgi:hypothetical protein